MVNFYFDKMAERGREGLSNFRGIGRVRVLVEAIEDLGEEGREVGDLPPHLQWYKGVGQGPQE